MPVSSASPVQSGPNVKSIERAKPKPLQSIQPKKSLQPIQPMKSAQSTMPKSVQSDSNSQVKIITDNC